MIDQDTANPKDIHYVNRTKIIDGVVKCPCCAESFKVVQNQTDGASYAKDWKKLERGTDKIVKHLLMSDCLDVLKNGMSKRDIIKIFKADVPEISNPARLSELIALNIFTVDKTKNPPSYYFKPELAGRWVAETFNKSNKQP